MKRVGGENEKEALRADWREALWFRYRSISRRFGVNDDQDRNGIELTEEVWPNQDWMEGVEGEGVGGECC